MTVRSTSDAAGQAAGPISIGLSGVISPEQFATACTQIVTQHDGHSAHHMLDHLVTEVLGSLGYSEGMSVFLQHVASFHNSPTPSGVAPTDNAANLCVGQNLPEPLELEAGGSGGKDQRGFHAATQ